MHNNWKWKQTQAHTQTQAVQYLIENTLESKNANYIKQAHGKKQCLWSGREQIKHKQNSFVYGTKNKKKLIKECARSKQKKNENKNDIEKTNGENLPTFYFSLRGNGEKHLINEKKISKERMEQEIDHEKGNRQKKNKQTRK